jgi:hypothetical protein
MKSASLLRFGWLALVLLVPAATAEAQVVRYATDFPNGTGWTLTGVVSTRWNVDATPGSVLGAPSWHSAPFSLNFNDGFCYGLSSCVGITFGTADSPPIDIGAPSGSASLSWWCLWDTETDGACYFDSRRVQVSNDGFQSLLLDQCYDDPVCGPAGVWHQHALALQPAWGTVQVRYRFHTGDGMLNGGAGWFVDDLEVTTDCVPPASYCTAKVNSLGCTPQIFSTGFPSPTQPLAFRIRARDVLNNKPGLLLYAYGSAATPFQGGFLCLASPIVRITVASSGGNPPPSDCSGLYAYDFNDRIRSGVDPSLVPGEDVYAQYWSRDPQAPFGSGLSDALTFVICP